jgi:S-methylmethionine-dependent homocysteine/selenocysteine methylase
MEDLIQNNSLLLMEAAIVEQLRRSGQVSLHDRLLNAPLIYDPASRAVMASLYRQYMDLAEQAGLPMLVCAPTWRASQDRVQDSGVRESVNEDAVAFMQQIRHHDTVRIGGLMGCKHDCYQPEEGLSAEAAQAHHAWQIERLAGSGVDFLMAATLPNVQEALGIARAMAATDTAAIISFVIGRDGRILDGSTLEQAMALIDSEAGKPPLGYMINCAHPSFLQPATLSQHCQARLIGFQANASSLDHCELENASEMKVDSIDQWGQLMLALNQDYAVPILGGCCGTGIAHLEYIIEHRGRVVRDSQ